MHRLDDALPVHYPAGMVMQPPHALLLVLRSPPPGLDCSRVQRVVIHMPHLHVVAPAETLARRRRRCRPGRAPVRIGRGGGDDQLLAIAADVARVVKLLCLAARHGAGFAPVETVPVGVDA